MFRSVLIPLAIVTVASRLSGAPDTVEPPIQPTEQQDVAGTRQAFKQYSSRGCAGCAGNAISQLGSRVKN